MFLLECICVQVIDVCVCVCLCACMFITVYVSVHACLCSLVSLCACVCVCVCACVCIFMCKLGVLLQTSFCSCESPQTSHGSDRSKIRPSLPLPLPPRPPLPPLRSRHLPLPPPCCSPPLPPPRPALPLAPPPPLLLPRASSLSFTFLSPSADQSPGV